MNTNKTNHRTNYYKDLSDEQTEKAGAKIAMDFELKRSREHPDRWQTVNGTFTNKGIARRALRLIFEAF